MADPQQAPVLTGWCRRGGKGGALPSKCPLFANLISFQMQDIKVPGTLDLCRGGATAANRSEGDLMAKTPPGN